MIVFNIERYWTHESRTTRTMYIIIILSIQFDNVMVLNYNGWLKFFFLHRDDTVDYTVRMLKMKYSKEYMSFWVVLSASIADLPTEVSSLQRQQIHKQGILVKLTI